MPSPLSTGLSILQQGAEDFAKNREEAQKAQDQAAGNRQILNALVQQGIWGDKEIIEYNKKNDRGRNDMVAAGARAWQFKSAIEDQQLQRDAAKRAAEAIALENKKYEHVLAQEKYAREFTPTATEINVPTGRRASPYDLTQAAGGTGVPWDPNYTVPETEPVTAIRMSPTGAFDIRERQFTAPGMATTVRDESGRPVARAFPTSRTGVQYEKLEKPLGPPKVSPFPGAPNLRLVGREGEKEFKVVGVPPQGRSLADIKNIFENYGIPPGDMLNPEKHHGFDNNGKSAPWEQATQIQVGKGPILPKESFQQLQQMALSMIGPVTRGRSGPGIVQTAAATGGGATGGGATGGGTVSMTPPGGGQAEDIPASLVDYYKSLGATVVEE
jgi:hypothetical protein